VATTVRKLSLTNSRLLKRCDTQAYRSMETTFPFLFCVGLRLCVWGTGLIGPEWD
jgi:hypothetical protein